MDPGTIYSDDEIEGYSDENDEDMHEEYSNKIPNTKQDAFYSDLYDGLDPDIAASDRLPFSGIKKYMNNKKSYDIDSAIDRVRGEFTNNKEVSDKSEEEVEETKNNLELEKVKLKNKDIKKKERKKVRYEEKTEQELQKEKEEMSFEIAPVARSNITFLEMNLSAPILKGIANMGYQQPTPIQAATIPVALKGRDICGCAATGTGKTAAFMLPILQRLVFRPFKDTVTRVLILVPTRELGIQVFEVSRELARFSKVNISLTVGGLNMNTQTEELLNNPDIIIATPGRLIDHIHNTKSFTLKEIEILVLDEADRMLDQFFVEQLSEIVKQCCVTRQTMLFSATMTDKVKDLISVSLKNPVRVFVNNNTDVAHNLRQEFIRIHKNKKADAADDSSRVAVLVYLLCQQFKEECMVFISKRSECHRMHILFGLFGLKCGELHGKLKQNERLESLQNFKDRKIDILFATDVAARGLDIKGVKTVINYTVPLTYEMYVHRVGRTARAGYSGRSVTISYDSGNDYTMLRQIQKNSLSPLYERVIDPGNISKHRTKFEALLPAIEKVLKMEEEEKQLIGAGKAIVGLEKKLSAKDKNNLRSDKRLKISFQTPEEITKEKERLKLVIQGKIPLRPLNKKKGAKKEEGTDNKPDPNKRRRAKGKANKSSDADEHPKKSFGKKSNFERELTLTDRRSVRGLRQGPSYQERKDDFAAKNPGKKFQMNKNKFKKKN